MSVTITPDKGTWISYHYYDLDESDDATTDRTANGIIRFEDEEPSMNLANSNFAWFAKMLCLNVEDGLVGTLGHERMHALLALCEHKRQHNTDEQLEHYLVEFSNIARHCIYHGCGASFA